MPEKRPVKLSDSTRKMLREGRGYRCESAFGSGVRTPSDIVRYEYYDLGNDEDAGQDQMIQALGLAKSTTPDVVFLTIEEEYDDDWDGLWLATKTECKEVYCNKGEEPAAHPIPSDAIILQDKGSDGALFLFQKRPTKRAKKPTKRARAR